MVTENSLCNNLSGITCSLLFALLVLAGCSAPRLQEKTSPPFPQETQHVTTRPTEDPIAALLDEGSPDQQQEVPLQKMGYSTQVGAFVNLDNAVRLVQFLEARGIDAYYFRDESGLYKVRFGNHASYQPARSEAEHLQSLGRIDSFFIVSPEDYAAARIQQSGKGDLRSELVKTAKQFIGIPYRWGGTTADNGFDCSGLTMVSYRLNGLNLPRVSRNQFQTGKRVTKEKLLPGDLVFFATEGGKRVTHVGMYVGNGNFIHAPRAGKNVRIEKLSNSFFTRTYMGGRSYL
ncbi:MAG: C40 family peptidase [Desulfuromonadales bacterium]